MADFTPKKVASKAKSGQGPAAGGARGAEHESPPHIYLEHHHLEKLGMTKMPPVGSKIKISGLAHVGAVSEHDESRSAPSGSAEGGPKRSMTLHLHKMDIGKDGISEGEHEESQKAGMKGEIDKALSRGAGSDAAKGTAKGKTPTPRGGGD
jgi:hypothetical protein